MLLGGEQRRLVLKDQRDGEKLRAVRSGQSGAGESGNGDVHGLKGPRAVFGEVLGVLPQRVPGAQFLPRGEGQRGGKAGHLLPGLCDSHPAEVHPLAEGRSEDVGDAGSEAEGH